MWDDGGLFHFGKACLSWTQILLSSQIPLLNCFQLKSFDLKKNKTQRDLYGGRRADPAMRGGSFSLKLYLNTMIYKTGHVTVISGIPSPSTMSHSVTCPQPMLLASQPTPQACPQQAPRNWLCRLLRYTSAKMAPALLTPSQWLHVCWLRGCF